MRRLAPIVLVLAALTAATGAALADGTDPQRPRLAATLETCATSALPASRVAAFVGSMPAVHGARVMRMRFDLERLRPRDARWRRQRGVRGFGRWERASPRRAGFVFHKRIDSLGVPSSYRAVVRFRWQDARGRVVRRARRRTAACTQPDLRPNLVPGTLTAAFDTRPGLAIYSLAVRNTGRTASAPFAVRVAGARTEVEGLGPREQRTVLVAAPVCLAGTSTRAEVDADDQIDESRERGNSVARRCPLWGA